MSRKSTTAASALALALALGTPLSAHALRVVRDAGTGELRAPNAIEAAAFERAEAQLRAARASAVVAGKQQPVRVTGVETRHADGSVEMTLGEDTHMYSVVSTAPDGSLQMDCVPAAEAQQLMKGSKSVTAVKAGAARATKAAHSHE